MVAHVYLLRCKDGALYTGYTVNLLLRLQAHHAGRGSKSVKMHGGPVEFAWHIQTEDQTQARSFEVKVKKLPRSKREALVRKNPQTIADLTHFLKDIHQ